MKSPCPHRAVDSHCHLDMPQFDADRADVVARAGTDLAAVLTVCTATPDEDLRQFLRLLDSQPWLFGAVGIHPHDARFGSEAFLEQIGALFEHPRLVGWGEIGLDYHYDHSPRDQQKLWFERQVELAQKKELPVIIHSRQAESDILEILEQHRGGPLRGVFHSFSADAVTARRGLELGFYLSFSGMLTFRKADALREIARDTPLDRLLIETDAPYLAPEPCRGKRNEPAWVVRVAETLAALHGVAVQEVCRQTTENFCRLFGVDVK
ncbi:MAG: TatD family hydrolase [Acidobacteriota bacterium]